MQNCQFQFRLVLLLFFGLSGLHSQTMYVRPTNGTQTAYPITNIQKLTFSSDNLLVTPKNGSIGIHSLQSNKYINFTDLTLTTAEQQIEIANFYVYPNPVKDILNFSLRNKELLIVSIEIITLEGRLVLKQKQNNNSLTQTDVSKLPKGLYLCKITSNSSTQIIKFLKQ